jgi:hypothetical protein
VDKTTKLHSRSGCKKTSRAALARSPFYLSSFWQVATEVNARPVLHNAATAYRLITSNQTWLQKLVELK